MASRWRLAIGFLFLFLFGFRPILCSAVAADLVVVQDEAAGTIVVARAGESSPIITQHARSDFRPYLHPIVAPDGKGQLTEYSPGHHQHQTGLYWGFTRVNGRDYFHHPDGDYWRRVSAEVITPDGHEVRWRTVYDLLNEQGAAILRETQTWSMHAHGNGDSSDYMLALEWQGEALADITIGKYDYGGLFLRMPWTPGISGEVVNAARNRGASAEGKRAPWIDVGMQVAGRNDLAHVAIFDHGENKGYPQHWRVDGQLGVGPIRARASDWKIKQGEREVIRHGIYIYTGELNDRELTNKWSAYSGVGGTWALWHLAQQEGRAAEFLTADQAVEAMTLPEGFEVNAYAHEPMITQPMAFCWDDRGRMWIAENRDYESRGEGFANSGDSRILILEDTDRDGVADSRTVFCEGIPFPSAIAVGFDGLFLGAPPNLLFVPDRNHDDHADMEDIEVRLTGWGIRDRHETLNSFHWGPAGWLYGCQGFATPSRVGKPAGKGRLFQHEDPFPSDVEFDGESILLDGGVWRYHPTQDRFEVVAHGFSNPWGIDYDAKGQLFISACVIPHLWHVIPGGIYHRQGGQHINRHVYSDIRTIADHRHRSAHGGARIYLSDAFPDRYHDRIFMANIHEHAVLTDILEPSGSGFIGRHGDDFLLANNAQWIGFSMEIGPEGAVYVLDWHDADICGKEVLQKETGRVFRITGTDHSPEDWPDRYADLSTLDDRRLAELQTSRSAWHARRARLILQHRAHAKGAIDATAVTFLRELFQTGHDVDHRLRALWSLHVVGQLPMLPTSSDQPAKSGPVCLLNALGDQDEHIRAWAIQLAWEQGADQPPQPSLCKTMMRMAKSDPSPVVRLYLASSLQRMGQSGDVWAMLEQLILHGEDRDDHNIPKLLWFGTEPHVVADPQRALQIASASQIPDITRFIARRLADANQFEQVAAGVDRETRPAVQLLMLSGMLDGLEGRVDVPPPSNWSVVYERLEKTGEIAHLATRIAQAFGDRQAIARLMDTVTDVHAAAVDRKKALRGLANQGRDEIRDALPQLLDDDLLRRDVIRAMAHFDDGRLTDALLNRYQRFTDDDKREAIQTLASRRASANALTERLKSGKIPKRDVPAYVARQMRRVVGNSFVDVWGPIDALSADSQAALRKYRSLLTPADLAAADPHRGRAIFNRTCLACHKLYGEGGVVGPDITGANRANLDYLLGNILTPSAEIQDAYKMTLVLTDNGRTYSGIVAGEDDRQLRLRLAGEEEPVVIPKSSIESRDIAPVSMMPDGILGTLQDQEVLDLVSYLQMTEQVALP